LEHIKKHILKGLLVVLSFCFFISQTKAVTSLKRVKYNYILNIPADYEKYPDKKWPVIFYLHGRHASGKNLQSIKRYGLPYFLSKGKKMDCIVVSPQCPWGKNWSSEDWFNPVFDEVTANLRIDDARVYLVGISMGGFGTWALANRMPDRFAAIAPFCGGGDVKWAETLSKVPAWVFHGTVDCQIPISRSEAMVKALEKLNAEIKFTRLKNEGHDISRQFNNDELYNWLLSHSTGKKLFWQEPLFFIKPIDSKQVTVRIPFQPVHLAFTD
jgi:predicted peptidase